MMGLSLIWNVASDVGSYWRSVGPPALSSCTGRYLTKSFPSNIPPRKPPAGSSPSHLVTSPFRTSPMPLLSKNGSNPPSNSMTFSKPTSGARMPPANPTITDSSTSDDEPLSKLEKMATYWVSSTCCVRV